MAVQTAVTRMTGAGIEVEVVFDYDGVAPSLRVAYRVRNTGAGPVAVFDRGDRQQVASGRLAAGDIAAPVYETPAPGDLVLVHAARPLPQPPPTLPPTPLAARLAPATALAGAFAFALPGAARRLRWCLGVAEFDATDFDAPQTLDGVSLWRAGFAVVDRQQRLCTPWFETAAGAFAG